MINIIRKSCSNFSSRDGYVPEIIVVHISAGTLASMNSWFANPGSFVSAHYGVGKDGTIVQYVDEANMAWSNGRVNYPTFKLLKKDVNPNKYTISIENEGMDLAKASDLQLQVLYYLIKDIAKRYNIPLDRDHIIGHFEIDSINKPFCPSRDHTIMDKIVKAIAPEEQVCVMCPKSKVDAVLNFIKGLI